MSVYRYPERAVEDGRGGGIEDPNTLATDYLMIHRHRVNYDDGGAGNNFYSRKTPGNHQKIIYNDDVVYIAMPPNIQTSYGPAYKRMDIGVGGITGTQLLDGGNDMGDIVKSLMDAAKTALPEFQTSTAISLINATNNFLGLSGAVDLNTIEQLRNGRIFNPFSEQIFAGMSFRTHNFAFKFFIRNDKEAEQVFRIIRYLKIGALPGIDDGDFPDKYINRNKKFQQPPRGGQESPKIKRDDTDMFDSKFTKHFKDGYASDDRYFTVPDRFDLRFCRFKTTNKQGPERQYSGKVSGNRADQGRRDLMFKMYPSVCTGISVNYTPDNQYVARKRPGNKEVDVPAVVVSCSFTETRLLTRRDVSVGY